MASHEVHSDINLMPTLYEILGINRDATSEQVAKAFESQRSHSQDEKASSEQDLVKLMAIKEAYAVLSSPERRKAYDLKLTNVSKVTWEDVEQVPVPWLRMVLVIGVLLLGGAYYFKIQQNQSRTDQLSLEANKAQAQADKARFEAEAETARLEREKILDKAKENETQRADAERHARASEEQSSRTANEKEATAQRLELARRLEQFRGGSPELSQSELLAKASIVSFSVASIEPDKFDIDVQYNYDASAGPIDIAAWVTSARAPRPDYTAVSLTPGQNQHVRISVRRPSIVASFTTTTLTITLMNRRSPFLKKIYPWTHEWPEIRSFS
jgi:hypothetical protein